MNVPEPATRVRRGPVRESLALGFLLGGIAAACAVDLWWLDVPLLAEGRPRFGGAYVARTVLVAVGCGLFVWMWAPSGRGEAGVRDAGLARWGTLGWSPGPGDAARFAVSVTRLVTWVMVLIAAGFVLLFLVSPRFFSVLGREGRPVEVLSAAMLLVSSGLFVYVAVVVYRLRRSQRRVEVFLALALAFVFFLIGMEEVSWFQRPLGIVTPEAFGGNRQGEMNLHNFATSETENAYYFSAFLLLLLIPFMGLRMGASRAGGAVGLFTPSPFITYPAALLAAFNYDMWNIVLTQTAFFTTVGILLYYARWDRGGAGRVLALAVPAVVVAVQLLFLLSGDQFIRRFDVKEYKEFLIPAAFLIYAVDVLVKLGRAPAGR